MEVRPGYRQTEVGVIPEDWGLEYIENLAHVTTGSRNTQDRVEDGRYPFFVRSQTVERINSYSFDGEAVLTAGDGVGTGKVFHYINGRFDAHQRVYRISEFSERVSGYFFYLYFSSHFYGRIMQMTAKSSVDSVRREMIARMQIPLPPTKAEQEAICDVLSDTDALIESLEQLLVKKRRIKQGVRQELLAGNKRLPGFSGVWEVRRLGEIFSISAGKSKSAYLVGGGRYWVVDMGSVSTDGRLTVSKTTNHASDILRSGELVMPKDDIGGGGIIGKTAFIDSEETYVLGDHVYRLTATQGDALFLSYVINGHRTNAALRSKVVGSAQLGLGRRSVEEQEVPFPPYDEQKAIAGVLSVMDADIAALETKLAKIRQIRQGMMHELITGTIRLL